MRLGVRSRSRFVAGAAAALGGAALLRAPARAARFAFRCASEYPVDHPSSVRMRQMCAAIRRESGGRIELEFFPNSQLGSMAAMFDQLRLGALQFLLVSPGNLAAVVPPFDITSLGFAFKDEDEAFRVMDGPLSEYLRSEGAAKGIYLFRKVWNAGMYAVGSVPRPIAVPDDLHGFKIRVAQSKIAVDLFKSLGANPTTTSFNEVYTALQTKLIDGEAASVLTIQTSRFFEVNRYVSLTNHSWAGIWFVANGDVWKGLPPDLQEIVERNSAVYALLERRDGKLGNAAVAAKLARQGLTLNKPDQGPFRARLGAYYQTWSSAFGPTAWGYVQNALGRKLS